MYRPFLKGVHVLVYIFKMARIFYIALGGSSETSSLNPSSDSLPQVPLGHVASHAPSHLKPARTEMQTRFEPPASCPNILPTTHTDRKYEFDRFSASLVEFGGFGNNLRDQLTLRSIQIGLTHSCDHSPICSERRRNMRTSTPAIWLWAVCVISTGRT